MVPAWIAPLIEIAKALGIPVALLAYFILRDWLRSKQDQKEKDKLTERITKIEDYQKGRLEELAVKSTVALEENSRLLAAFIRTLEKRPCVANDVENIKDNM